MIGAWKPLGLPVPSIEASITMEKQASLLFLGDLHLDNPKVERRGLKALLTEAVEREAAIVLLGDVFDGMQGKSDRRSAKSAMKAAYAGRDDYYNAIVEDVAEFLTPFAKNVWVLLEGNHESGVRKHAEVDLTRLLARELNAAGGSVVTPGYASYAMVRLDVHKRFMTVPFWLAHGHGGGGEVTKGTIQAQRRAVTYPDARYLVSGHIHNAYFVPHAQHRVTERGVVYDVEQEQYAVGSWKDEHSSKRGYHVEKGRGPTPPSGWWVDFKKKRLSHEDTVRYDARWYRAIP